MHALGGRTPFEVVHKCKPNLKGLLEWGTHIFVLCEGRGKLEERANEGHWVRYSADSATTFIGLASAMSLLKGM